MRRRVLVIGGGITGLAAARTLIDLSADVDVSVLEATSQVGGKLCTHEVDGLVLDAGAESVLARRPQAMDLVEQAGLSDEVVHPAVSGATVWVDGQLRPLPHQQLLGIPADDAGIEQSGVLDRVGLARLREDSTLGSPAVTGDTSVGALVRSRMGDQVVDRLVEPLLGGVYAGSADLISADMALPGVLEAAQREPSLMASVRSLRSSATGPVFASVRGGLGRLPRALQRGADIDVRTHTRAVALRRSRDGWLVSTEADSGSGELGADAVILACPAGPTAALVGPHAKAGVEALDLDYASVVLATYVFRGVDRPSLPAGTGFLVPPSAGGLLKAATFVSQKWQWVAEAAPDAVVVRVSMGRFGDTHVWERPDDELGVAALSELQRILSTDATPHAVRVTRWERSLPQYRVGHRARVARLREALTADGGLEICGAAVDGVGIASCIESGGGAATRVAGRLGIGGQ